MPCRDDGWPPTPSMEPVLVNMLCAALSDLEDRGLPIPPVCVTWWKAHKAEDAARIRAEARQLAAEKKRKDILSKLTPEEQKILGLKED